MSCMKELRWGAFLAAVVAASCSQSVHSVPAESPIQKAIQFEENPEGEAPRNLSRVKKGGVIESVVPSPGALDLNSKLKIRIDKDELMHLASSSPELVTEIARLETARTALVGLLQDFAALNTTRKAALDRYRAALALDPSSPNYASQIASAKNLLRGLDQDTQQVGRAAGGYFRTYRPDRYRPASRAALTLGMDTLLPDLIQAELDETARELEHVRRQALADGFELRIEAFLDGPDRPVMPVHVDGYDRLPEGKLERRDRFGLNLQGAALAQYQNLRQQSVDIADALEDVNTGEADLTDALASLTSTVIGPPAALAAEGIDLAVRVQAIPARITATQTAAAQFVATVNAAAGTAVRTSVAAFNNTLTTELAALQGQLGGAAIAQLLLDGARLGELLKNPTPAGIMEFQSILLSLPGQAAAIAASLGTQATGSVGKIQASIQSVLNSAPAMLRSQLDAAWASSGLKAEVETWQALAKDVEHFVGGVNQLVDGGLIAKAVPVPTNFRNKEAIDVPFAEIRDTWIDLERTPRLVGETLTVRVTPLRAGETLDSPLAVPFGIEQYGWHARLDPSVVMARPTSLGARQERFQFAPMLSWSHTYTPRPEQDDWSDEFFRKTGFSIGPHATFLNTTDESNLEIGLGVTIGLWDGVLLIGGGWNLGADRELDGDYYYVVGSSLVSLLQKFQGGN